MTEHETGEGPEMAGSTTLATEEPPEAAATEQSHRRPRRGTLVAAAVGGLAVVAAGAYVVLAGDSEPTAPSSAGEVPVVDPLEGIYLGRARGTFVAVVAAPWAEGDSARLVTAYVTDGSSVSEWFEASTKKNDFSAESTDGDATFTGELARGVASGTLDMDGGGELEFEAERAGGASGLYHLSVDDRGKLSGTTPQGVGMTGRTSDDGAGSLELADGRTLTFSTDPGGTGPTGLDKGRVRVIVSADGDVVGVGRGSREGTYWVTAD